MSEQRDITVNDIIPFLTEDGKVHVRAAVAEYKNVVYEAELKALREQAGPPPLSVPDDTVVP